MAVKIDTKSKHYKAAVKQMMSSGAIGDMYANIQGIKNLMKNFVDNTIIENYG